MYDAEYSVKAKLLAKGTLAPCLNILRSHNHVIEKHGSKQKKMSLEKYREEFLAGRIQVQLSNKDKTALAGLTEDIKMKIIAHHIKMVQRIVNCFCRKFSVANPDDVASEGEYALVKALYAYTNQNVYFSTFAHWVVTNTLKDYFRENHNGLSPVSKIGVELNNRIECHRMKQPDHISFDQACRDLNLNGNDVVEATQARRKASVATSLQTKKINETIDILDKAFVEDNLIAPELLEAFNACPLSSLERVVMDAALNHWHGWMVDLGREYPHENGKPRERQHIRMVMLRAQKKIQEYYENSKRHTLSLCRAAS